MAVTDLDQFYNQRPILITGGLGFIGSNLAIKLVKLGAQVTILDALIPGLGGNRFNIEPIKNRVRLHIANLSSLDSPASPISLKSYSIIFNLAGSHSHIDSMRQPVKDLSLTCEPHLHLLEACRLYNAKIRIIMAGTRNQYGKPQYLPVDEKHPTNPIDINGAHWLAVENYHLLYHRVYGLKTCSLRLSNTYGPRHQMKHPYQGVLNWFIRQTIDGKPITLYGNGTQKRDAVYVDDVIKAFLLAGASSKVWGEVFNVGGKTTSLKEFAQLLIKLHGAGKIKTVAYPKEHQRIEVGDFTTNSSKIKQQLGWQAEVSLEAGLKKTLEFYKRNKKYYW